jgi:tRNA pseudouridine38-40 synthase
MGKRKFLGKYSTGRKSKDLREEENDDEDDGGADNRANVSSNERHPGSIPLELVKASEHYDPDAIAALRELKRKYAVCISYLGSNYQGLQINPDAKTVESELEKAFFLTGAIIESNYGFMSKIQWTRAARTDRGVHALSQCCAMKLVVSPNNRDAFIEKVNNILPPDIQVLGLTKVVKSFNARTQCGQRRYHYLLPTYTLQPYEAVNAILQSAFNAQGPVRGAGYEGGFVDPQSNKSLARDYLATCRGNVINYRVDEETLKRLKSALHEYLGTKSYHNFTSGIEKSPKRYMLSFDCGESFICEKTGVEYVLLSVWGQSFIFNQIRKMVGFAIAVARQEATLLQMQESFQPECRMDVPLAPSVGLYLDALFFDGYNMKQRRDNEQNPLSKRQPVPKENTTEGKEDEEEDDQMMREEIDWHNDITIKARMENFRLNRLHPHIFAQEAETLAFLYYLDYNRAHPQAFQQFVPKKPLSTEVAEVGGTLDVEE